MGMGMLFAGALTGGAQAMGQMADQAYKREDDERKRQQSIMDRRNELLFEMKAKSDMARREEEEAMAGFGRVAKRGEEITNERGARELEAARSTVPSEGEFSNEKITPEMIASMPPAARAIYEKEMGLTDDSSLQRSRDMVTASNEVTAPPSVRKGILESYREEFKADKEEKDRKFRAEQEDRKDARNEANNDAREERQRMRDEAMLERATKKGATGSIDQTEKLTVLKDVLAKAEASKPNRKDYRNEKSYTAAMEAWGESDSGKMAKTTARRINEILDGSQPSRDETGKPSGSSDRSTGDVAALQREIAAVERGNDKPEVKQERLRILNAELEKSKSQLAQKSVVKDNQTTIPPREQRTVGMRVVAPSGPHKGKTLEWAGEGWRIVN